jgi:hypothetical protein
VLKQNLCLFLILYCSSIIAGELSLVLLALVNKLSFTAPEAGGTDVLTELVDGIPFIATTSLIGIAILTFTLIFVVKIDLNWKKQKNKSVILLFVSFSLMLALWYYFFMFMMIMYGFSREK